ncbi:unnamed protein product (macronuclear) [Paramecium tetraurelia]|uniref:Uncharacterized protein n=1 Tax=Paramecium tetraurelia TaxID=5888 RepID=A0C0I1_PARTE|nr:uncharacterized protein GSPATT00006151001 [Paramecium tetraurelia]CAK64298.1 unnamed protein product [Paramecium tetraurelia]|eukprot:XP_001431696.1 hypothetical protein (macronuclear) [Paramecium tetraurelia strain d4-2]
MAQQNSQLHLRYWSSSDWDFKKKKELQHQMLVTRQRFFESMRPQEVKRINTTNFHQYVIDIREYYEKRNQQLISSKKYSRSTKSLKNIFSNNNLMHKFKSQPFFPDIN